VGAGRGGGFLEEANPPFPASPAFAGVCPGDAADPNTHTIRCNYRSGLARTFIRLGISIAIWLASTCKSPGGVGRRGLYLTHITQLGARLRVAEASPLFQRPGAGGRWRTNSTRCCRQMCNIAHLPAITTVISRCQRPLWLSIAAIAGWLGLLPSCQHPIRREGRRSFAPCCWFESIVFNAEFVLRLKRHARSHCPTSSPHCSHIRRTVGLKRKEPWSNAA